MAGEIDCRFEDIVPDSNIPGDLMVSILTRLPVKSLFRFKAVSKPWCCLISSPSFVNLHLRRQSVVANSLLVSSRAECFFGLLTRIDEKKNTCVDNDVFVLESSPLFDNFPVSSTGDKAKFMLIGSCNGLVCLCCLDPHLHGGLTLWNPATRKCRRIQLPDGDFTQSYCTFGLCYVEATNDFKIVGWSVTYDRIKTPFLFEYSLSSDSWKKWDCDYDGFLFPVRFPTFINGCMNWMSKTPAPSHVVASFDVTDGAFSFFGVPHGYKDKNILRPTLAIRGCLAIPVSLDFNDMESGIEFWVMEKYGDEGSWVKRFTIRESRKPMNPLTLWNEDEIIVGSSNASGVVGTFYDLFNNNKYFLEFKSLRMIQDIISYVESLASVGTEKKLQADVVQSCEEGYLVEMKRNCKLM